MRNSSSIFDLSFQELTNLRELWGEPPYRSTQLWDGLYRKLWTSPTEFSNFPKYLRSKLDEQFVFHEQEPQDLETFSSLKPIRKLQSEDGETTKTLFSLL